MRSLDSTGQGLTAFFIVIFAIPPALIFIGMASERSLWIAWLSWMPFYVIVAVMRKPLARLARGPRFIAWFSIGVTGATIFALGSGRADFTLPMIVGLGLFLALLDLIGTYWAERKAANG